MKGVNYELIVELDVVVQQHIAKAWKARKRVHYRCGERGLMLEVPDGAGVIREGQSLARAKLPRDVDHELRDREE